MVQESPEIENDKISKPGGAKTRRCQNQAVPREGVFNKHNYPKQTCLYFIISVSDTDVSFVLKLIH